MTQASVTLEGTQHGHWQAAVGAAGRPRGPGHITRGACVSSWHWQWHASDVPSHRRPGAPSRRYGVTQLQVGLNPGRARHPVLTPRAKDFKLLDKLYALVTTTQTSAWTATASVTEHFYVCSGRPLGDACVLNPSSGALQPITRQQRLTESTTPSASQRRQ